MAVTRSPFSSKPQAGGSDSGTPIYDSLKKKSGVPVPAPPNKTNLIEEKAKLASAVTSTQARAAGAVRPDPKAIADIQKIAETGKEPDRSKGLLGMLGKIAVQPIRGIGKVFETGAAVGRNIQSGIKETGDLLIDGLDKVGLTNEKAHIHAKKNSASWKDFRKQATDKDFKLIKTGVGWLDSTLDFAVDVATDPLTYLGAGVGAYAGATGRTVLATKFATTEMLAKYPQMASKLDDILRYGEWAIPKDIRDAEGIKTGLRFAGKLIPKTEKLAQGVTGKYGLISGPRRALGDIVDTLAPNAKRFVTPKSLKPLTEAGAGRGFQLAVDEVVPLLAHSTARRFSRGATTTSYTQNVNGIKDTIKQLRALGPEVNDQVRRAVDDIVEFDKLPAGEVKDLAIKYKAWQDDLREQVNSVYKKFGDDYGAKVREIGFVDNYLHHRLSAKAAEVVLNPRYAKFFKDEDLTAEELTGITGAMRHRRLRGPRVNPKTGETEYAQFMGENVQKGTIDEINQIFRDKTGLDVDFFETDMSSIADSYAYSMAKAKGRESYFRRLMDFGDDTVQVIGTKLSPNNKLIGELTDAHKKLIQARNALTTKVSAGRKGVTSKAQGVLKQAQDILDGKARKGADVDKKIAGVKATLEGIENQLSTALLSAQGKQANEVAGFLEMWGPLLDEVRIMRTAVENGQAEEYAVVKQLKEIYAALYPNRKNIPDTVQALKEAIDVKTGKGVVPKETREINKRLKQIQAELSQPVEDGAMRQQLLDEERMLVEHLGGIQALGGTRAAADYAPDGVLYGKVDDIVERPFNPNEVDQRPFRTLDTKVINPDDIADDGGAAYFDFWRNEPDSVMVHAIPTEELVDLRDPDGYYWFFSPDNNVHEALGQAMNRAGLQGDTFISEYESALNEGLIDPMFEELFPEMNDLLNVVYNADQLEFAGGVVDEEALNGVFNSIRETLTGIAASNGLENADLVGKQIYDDFLGYMADAGAGDMQGFIMPSTLVYGPDNLSAQGSYSVVIPDRYGYTKGATPEELAGKANSKVQFVKDNDFAKTIIDNEYEGASFIANEALSSTVRKLADIEGAALTRQELASEAKRLGGRKGAIAADNARKQKAVEKAVRRFQEAGTISFKVNGETVELPRDKVLGLIAAKEKKIKSAYDRLYAKLDGIVDAETKSVIAQRTSYEQRLSSLFNQKKVLQRWDETTGAQLRNDIAVLEKEIMDEPPEGAAGVVARAWADKVRRSIDAIPQIKDKSAARAYDRVVTTLHADEGMLALLDSEQIPEAAAMINAAKSGLFGGKIQDDIYDGWKQIESLGLQVPEEVDALWRPNLDKLRSKANRNAFVKAYQQYHKFFKIYAMASTGFSIRNAMSATFMNWVAGVGVKEMAEGPKVGAAIMKHGNDWLDELGLEGAERELYEQAWRATEATGRGMGDELAIPAVKGVGARLLDNKFTRFFSGFNDYVERSVRFPMALDSLRKGMSYDEAVTRIAKYHFDYSDVSALDEKAMNFVPFWIWTTRNIPLQITQMWTRPSAYATYDKVRQANPVNEELIVPSWMSDLNPLGFGENAVLTPDLPMNRLEKSAKDLFSPRILGMLNPALKLPIELGVANKQLALDIPFSDKYEEAKGIDKAIAALGELIGADSLGRRDPETGKLLVSPKVQYALGNLIPTLAQVERLSGGAVGGKGTYEERQLSSILNYVGIPVRQVGEQQQRSEVINRQFKVKDYAKWLEKQGKLGPKED